MSVRVLSEKSRFVYLKSVCLLATVEAAAGTSMQVKKKKKTATNWLDQNLELFQSLGLFLRGSNDTSTLSNTDTESCMSLNQDMYQGVKCNFY